MKSLSQIALVAALLTGAGETFAKPAIIAKTYNVEKQNRHLSGFSAISVTGSYDVYITQGNSESVTVEADDDIINRIITEVKDGELRIYTKKGDSGFNFSWGDKNKMIIRIAAKDLNEISLTGSGDVFFKDGLRASKLALSVTGSGDITGKVEVKNLESTVTGSGDIALDGRAESSVVKVSGSGDFRGKTLVTNNTTVRVVGSGDASVNVTRQITASVAGSGDIRYTGSAKQITTSKSGSGDINRF
jgi:hypothetical protein